MDISVQDGSRAMSVGWILRSGSSLMNYQCAMSQNENRLLYIAHAGAAQDQHRDMTL